MAGSMLRLRSDLSPRLDRNIGADRTHVAIPKTECAGQSIECVDYPAEKTMKKENEMHEVSVLIVGGGPVGLTLSLELAHYGVKCLLVERNSTTTRTPKMELTNGRSMELFRRTGVADLMRAVGIPPEHCFDVSWVTSLAGHELYRFTYPSAAEGARIRCEQNDGSLTLEPPLRASQIVIEPALRQAAEEAPNIEVRFGWRLESFAQDEAGVTAMIRNVKTGEEQQVRSAYLVGCDGGGSTVRAQLGIEYEGTPEAANMLMIYFRSKDRGLLQRFGVALHYQTGSGLLVAQDDDELWLLHTFWPPDVDRSQLNPREVLEDWIGRKFDYEILIANPWSGHYLIAEEYRKDRVFIAGDACHQVVPAGGYGMNSGVADAANLGWKIAAVLHGWGGEVLLESYEAERRPVAEISKAASQAHLEVRFAFAMLYAQSGDLSGDDAEAVGRRAVVARRIEALGNLENEAWGTEHGYLYDGSPVVIADAGEAPMFDAMSYTPSTWPGSRLPHVFLEDGRALYDLLGKWLTLIVLDDSDTAAIENAARARGIPLAVLSITDENVARIYERKLILVRSDHHVAWRGDVLPEDSSALLTQVLGLSS